MIKKKLTELKKKRAEDLHLYFLEKLEVDVTEKVRHEVITYYRSLFNTILKRKYKYKTCQIQRFYKSKGTIYNHATILNSISKFNKYCSFYPELKDLLFEIHPSAKKHSDFKRTIINLDKRDLTPIQKLVENLTPEQEKELSELITLRKKSWEWKSKDKITIYSGC